MGATEDAMDAAAHFVGPFVEKSRNDETNDSDASNLVDEALSHLQAINTADLAADPNAPYDASLAGVVYGLLDIISLLAIVAQVSPGVTFGQRPKSVLNRRISLPSERDERLLARATQALIIISKQGESGVQPLVSQRIFPDIVSALAELSFAPTSRPETRLEFTPIFERILAETPTSRLLPILTTFLQQPLPEWLKPVLSRELTLIPLRPQGIRHTIEFLSLAYLSKNAPIPQNASSPQSQVPIPLEAITQASRLLILPPSGFSQDAWVRALSPQLLALLDGADGRELSVAASQIIAGGLLNKKTTGAPGTVGWELFVLPLLRSIHPKDTIRTNPQQNGNDQVIVPENELKLALERLSVIVSSCSHAGLLRRLIGPLILSLWTLLNHAKARPSLAREWSSLSRGILLRYMALACDDKHIDNLATNLFWSGDASWKFGPGSQGGVEIRERSDSEASAIGLDNILSQIETLETKINLLVSLLEEAKISDDVAGSIFMNATKRWLLPTRNLKASLTNDPDVDPLSALTDAKFSEALARKFQDQFARSPQHIIEFMGQLVQSFVSDREKRSKKSNNSESPNRAMLQTPMIENNRGVDIGGDVVDEDLVSFAMSILFTLISSTSFKQTAETTAQMQTLLPGLQYLSKQHHQLPLPVLMSNAASNLIDLIKPSASIASASPLIANPLDEHRNTIKTALLEIVAPEPPNRTWALNTLRKLIQNPAAFPAIDIPSLTHLLLSASLADPESYVHMAAIQVLVDLAVRAPNPTIGILADAFLDIDEGSLKLMKIGHTVDERKEFENALDYRLRIGEVLNNVVLDDSCWTSSHDLALRYRALKQIADVCLKLASRRGHRTKTLSTRTRLAEAEQKVQEEGEAAWGGPIPNLLEPEGADPNEEAERKALLEIVQGWEDGGVEEDVRIRASALSVLSTVFEHRLDLLRPATIDATLQIVLLILTLERAESKAILRRAGVLVIMGFLRSVDAAIEHGQDSAVRLSLTQQKEVERVVKWIKDEDEDALVRDHAIAVVEGLETLQMRKLHRIGDESFRLGSNFSLEGNLKGLYVEPNNERQHGEKRSMVEEIE